MKNGYLWLTRALMLCAVAALLGVFSTANAGRGQFSPTVTTDKADYAPRRDRDHHRLRLACE